MEVTILPRHSLKLLRQRSHASLLCAKTATLPLKTFTVSKLLTRLEILLVEGKKVKRLKSLRGNLKYLRVKKQNDQQHATKVSRLA